jgi:LuxR family maltose regulon positive regulatory protein
MQKYRGQYLVCLQTKVIRKGYVLKGYNQKGLLVKDMLSALLQTKLYVPSPKSRLVSRRRLLEKLDILCERKLCLISAPAGFGKTTLLAEWVEHQSKAQAPLQVTWLSLDANDNDPARFLTYVVAALQQVDASLGEEVQPILHSFQITSIKEIWEVLSSQVVSGNKQIVLVLDDYHLIEDPHIHEGIAYMLEHMPDCMHLVISTRADPPLPLSRLRVRGELIELRAGDLRFSSEEIADFINLWIGKKLSSSDQGELEARTEGWIAGLQLAALAMQDLAQQTSNNGENLTAFIQRLSGSNRFIMDYLVEEVLQRLPEEARSFLLQTSILERLSASLCNAITGRLDSKVILDSMEKTNLFLFPLDDERGWYRYHHLFADLLRSFLQHHQPAKIPELHAKASAWFEGEGLTTEAIQHTLQIPDPGEAARLMEQVVTETLMRGEVSTVQRWSNWIPDEQLRLRPMLCVCIALAYVISDKLEQVEKFLSLVDHSDTSQELNGYLMAAHSFLACCKGEYENAFQYERQALRFLPPEQTYLRGLLALSSSSAHAMLGEDDAAFQSLQEAKQSCHAFGNRIAELTALKNLGDLHMRRGQLHQAALSYHQALQLVSIREGKFIPAAARTLSAIGHLYYEWDQLKEAERYLLQGVELSHQLENPYYLLLNIQNLARTQWALGDRDNALRLRAETEQIILEFPPLPLFADQAALQQINMYLQMEDTQAAIRWAQTYQQDWESANTYTAELKSILRTRVLLVQEHAPEALEILEQTLTHVRAAGRRGVEIELLVLKALTMAMMHQIIPAIAALEQALQLAEPEGYMRIFLNEGEPMLRLLRKAYRSKGKGTRQYESKLLDRLLPTDAPTAPVSPQILTTMPGSYPTLIDPLTERELEVLRMIADGHSNQEIAEKLVVTLGTVKAHISHIYSKLDVRSRAQAIKKADQLRLLKP